MNKVSPKTPIYFPNCFTHPHLLDIREQNQSVPELSCSVFSLIFGNRYMLRCAVRFIRAPYPRYHPGCSFFPPNKTGVCETSGTLGCRITGVNYYAVFPRMYLTLSGSSLIVRSWNKCLVYFVRFLLCSWCGLKQKIPFEQCFAFESSSLNCGIEGFHNHDNDVTDFRGAA